MATKTAKKTATKTNEKFKVADAARKGALAYGGL